MRWSAQVTIVSRKVQTTRALPRIVIEDNAQIILVDTPASSCRSAGSTARWCRRPGAGAHDADLVCVLLDAKPGLTKTEAISQNSRP